MANADAYYTDPQSSTSPGFVDRLKDTVRTEGSHGLDMIKEKAAALKEPAGRAVAHVRENPRPYIIGAAAVAVVAVGVALLMNTRTREMSFDLARQALSKVKG